MGSRNEYTGQTPPELIGKRKFRCAVCNKLYPIASLDWHHIDPQAGGGTDDPSNFISADSGCHQFLHRIAKRLMSSKSGKTSALVIVKDFAESLFPGSHEKVDLVTQNIIRYAVKVAVSLSEKSSKGLIGKTDVIIKDLPPNIKRLAIRAGKKFRNNSNRKAGISGVALYATMTFLEKMFPEESKDIREFLSQRGFGTAEEVPMPSAISFKVRS